MYRHNLQQQHRVRVELSLAVNAGGSMLVVKTAAAVQACTGTIPPKAHSLAAGCIVVVMACNDPQQQRSILNTVCEGPNDIQ